MEELEARLDSLDIAVEAANEFMLEKLEKFENRISAMELKYEQEVNKIRIDIGTTDGVKQLRNVKYIATPVASTPVGKYGGLFSLETPPSASSAPVPTTIEDVPPRIQERLKHFMPDYGSKRKINCRSTGVF